MQKLKREDFNIKDVPTQICHLYVSNNKILVKLEMRQVKKRN